MIPALQLLDTYPVLVLAFVIPDISISALDPAILYLISIDQLDQRAHYRPRYRSLDIKKPSLAAGLLINCKDRLTGSLMHQSDL